MNNTIFELHDNEAQAIFKSIKGIDFSDRAAQNSHASDTDSSDATEEQLDKWRLLLIDIAHFIASYFTDVHFLAGVKTRKDTFSQLAETLTELAQMPGHGGNILIRYRGFPTCTAISPKADYVIFCGNLTIDCTVTATMFNRMGIQMTHLSGRLAKAFNVLSSHGISSLYLKIPETAAEAESEQMRLSLQMLSLYHHALKSNSAISLDKNGQQVSVPLIRDENGQPDPNLTLIAGLNNLTQPVMNEMISKINAWIIHTGSKISGDQNLGVYNAIFRIKKFKEQLIKPPVEVNNIKWTMIDGSGWKMISKEKAGVARMVMDKYGSSPQNATRVMQSVYGEDYKDIDSQNFGERMKLTAELLNAVEEDAKTEEFLNEILRNIQGRVEQTRDEVFDDVTIRKNEVSVQTRNQKTTIKRVHKKLLNILKFYKRRSVTKKKIRDIGRSGIDFDAQDYHVLAKDFNMPVEDVKGLIQLLKGCFDQQGHFLRKVFEQHIPEFAKYEKKVFEFIWHYLKETPERNDRVAFLNSLQLLIAQMKQRKKAVSVLLADFLKEPDTVNFSDRNAIMLSNLLVRKYNKELNVDIERTPEEVLQIQNGLDKDISKTASLMLDKEQEKCLEKMKAIQKKVIEALNPGKKSASPMPFHFLLALERELFMFFSFIGGITAHYALRNAIKQYSNLKSDIYVSEESRHHMLLILQHIRVLVRAVGRTGEIENLSFLEGIRQKEKEFVRMGEGTKYSSRVRQVMKWIDLSMKNIIQYADVRQHQASQNSRMIRFEMAVGS